MTGLGQGHLELETAQEVQVLAHLAQLEFGNALEFCQAVKDYTAQLVAYFPAEARRGGG